MSLDINTVLNNIAKNYNPSQAQNNKSTTTVDSNIFAQASALVAEYKAKQNSEKNNDSSSSSTKICGLSFTAIANMSTSDFLKYAYENQASSGFTSSSSNLETDGNGTNSSNIKLPLIVSYKGRVVSTAGKSFMAVVAKIKGKCPGTSEEKIAAELIAKYGNTSSDSNKSSTTNTSGKSLNISA